MAAHNVRFCYYGPTVGDMIKSHNSTLVGKVSTHFCMGSFLSHPFPVCVATLTYVY